MCRVAPVCGVVRATAPRAAVLCRGMLLADQFILKFWLKTEGPFTTEECAEQCHQQTDCSGFEAKATNKTADPPHCLLWLDNACHSIYAPGYVPARPLPRYMHRLTCYCAGLSGLLHGAPWLGCGGRRRPANQTNNVKRWLRKRLLHEMFGAVGAGGAILTLVHSTDNIHTTERRYS